MQDVVFPIVSSALPETSKLIYTMIIVSFSALTSSLNNIMQLDNS